MDNGRTAVPVSQMMKNWIRQRIRKRGKGPRAQCTRTIGQNIPKLATQKSSARLNMQQLREEHDKTLNDAKEMVQYILLKN